MDNLTGLQLDHEGRISHCESWLKQHQEDIERLERQQEDQAELVRSVAQIAQKQTDMGAELSEIKQDVKALAAKPGKRWDSIVDKALLTILTGLIGYIMIRLGLS